MNFKLTRARTRKRFLIPLTFVLLFAVLILVWRMGCFEKEPPVLPEYNLPEVSEKDNAAPLLLKSISLFKEPSAKAQRLVREYFIRGTWIKEYDGVAPWLDANSDALNLFEGALDKPGCRFPRRKDMPGSYKYPLAMWRTMTKLEVLKGAYLASRKKYDESLDCYDRLFKFGRLLRQGDYSSMSDIVGVGATMHGITGLFKLLLDEGAPVSRIKQIAQKEEERFPSSRDMILKDYREQNMLAAAIPEIIKKEIDEGGVKNIPDKKEVLESIRREYYKLIAYKYSKILQLVEARNWNGIEREFEMKEGFFPMLEGYMVNPDRRGAYSLSLSMIPNIYMMVFRYQSVLADLRAISILAAIKQYRAKYGGEPGGLGALVPEFLDKVPLDPFDGKPFRMVRTGMGLVVYSVGPDKIDGKSRVSVRGVRDNEGRDIVYPVDLLPPHIR
ncbi:MAG: hypothetical protein M1269_09165 [Chloroflexi bacterium]|nr:hypothetical protein [Chloroflexota bacterium]